VQQVDLFRPCLRRNSSTRGRATTGLPPPLAGDTSGQSSATHRSRVSPIDVFPRLFACCAITVGSKGGEGKGMVVKI
jgi:hypothetical protein